MAASTGIVLAAGGIAMADVLTAETLRTDRAVMVAAGTVMSAVVAAGLDRVLPKFGTGTAIVLLVSVIYRYGPDLSARLGIASLAKPTIAKGARHANS